MAELIVAEGKRNGRKKEVRVSLRYKSRSKSILGEAAAIVNDDSTWHEASGKRELLLSGLVTV